MFKHCLNFPESNTFHAPPPYFLSFLFIHICQKYLYATDYRFKNKIYFSAVTEIDSEYNFICVL